MKKNVHPKYQEVKVNCSCGHSLTTSSTLAKDTLHIEICSNCHPFYTGQQKMIDTAGVIDRFRKKYANRGKKPASQEKA